MKTNVERDYYFFNSVHVMVTDSHSKNNLQSKK